MRVTADTKENTRTRILAAASHLFHDKGFASTSTRDIASKAHIATGTLFNYFRSKESLAMTVIAGDLQKAAEDFATKQRGDESLSEVLFAYIAAGLYRLRSHRNYAAEVLETAFSPFSQSSSCPEAEKVRTAHLEDVADLIQQLTPTALGPPSHVAMHLYWTLYVGVLAFWATDESPHQEDTLVVLDQSTRLFVSSLPGHSGMKGESKNGTAHC